MEAGPRFPVDTPDDSVRFHWNGVRQALEIREPALGPGRLVFVVLGLAVVGVGLAVAAAMQSVGDPFALVIAAVAILLSAAALYPVLVAFVSHRSIVLDRSGVERRHEPLPWGRPTRLDASRLRRVRVVERATVREAPVGPGAPGREVPEDARRTHHVAVHLVLDDGSEEVLLLAHRHGIPPENAHALTSWLHAFYGLDATAEIDRPAPTMPAAPPEDRRAGL